MRKSSGGFEGFLIDLLDQLSKDIGFELTYQESTSYGKLDKNTGNWTGIVGKLIQKVSSHFFFVTVGIFSSMPP